MNKLFQSAIFTGLVSLSPGCEYDLHQQPTTNPSHPHEHEYDATSYYDGHSANTHDHNHHWPSNNPSEPRCQNQIPRSLENSLQEIEYLTSNTRHAFAQTFFGFPEVFETTTPAYEFQGTVFQAGLDRNFRNQHNANGQATLAMVDLDTNGQIINPSHRTFDAVTLNSQTTATDIRTWNAGNRQTETLLTRLSSNGEVLDCEHQRSNEGPNVLCKQICEQIATRATTAFIAIFNRR